MKFIVEYNSFVFGHEFHMEGLESLQHVLHHGNLWKNGRPLRRKRLTLQTRLHYSLPEVICARLLTESTARYNADARRFEQMHRVEKVWFLTDALCLLDRLLR